MYNNIFYIGLIISAVLHLMLIQIFSLHPFKKQQKTVKNIELIYKQLTPEKEKKTVQDIQEIEIVKKTPPPSKVKLLEKDLGKFSSIADTIPDISKAPERIELGRKKPPQIKTLDISEKITIPVLEAEKMTNPRFLNYYQTIRKLIRERANQYKDTDNFETGEVYLTFVLSSEGSLLGAQVINQKTRASDYLKDFGLKSVREAGPFPPFPKEIQYPELTINIIISFNLNG